MCSLIGIVDADLEMDDKGLNAAMKGMMRRAVSKANERFVICPLWDNCCMHQVFCLEW